MTPEQQFQQMTETAKKIPGDLQWMAYIALVVVIILGIMGIRKSYRYCSLDQSEKYYTGWGAWFYINAFGVLIGWYFFQSMSNITATMMK